MTSQLSKPDVAPIPATKDDVAADDASIVSLCDEVVAAITNINSPDGPLNRAEAGRVSEAAIEEARQQQAGIIDRLECLAAVIPERVAISEDEVAAKVRALDALTSVASWDRESLRVLRVSIGRDCGEMAMASKEVSPPRPHRPSWGTRRYGS